MLFQTGHLSDAAAVLEGRFGDEDGSRAASVLDAAGVVAFGRVALPIGDTRQVQRLSDIAHVMLRQGTSAVQRHAAWLPALVAAADGDAVAARACLAFPTAGHEVDSPALPRRRHRRHAPGIALHSADDELAQLALAMSQ
jgi:hypothetical protein